MRDSSTIVRVRALRPDETAWIAVLPIAAAIAAMVILLGPPLGDALIGRGSDTLWPRGAYFVFGEPDPAKRMRYALALLGPALLAVAVLVVARWPVRLGPRAIRVGVLTGQVVTVAILVIAVIGDFTSAEDPGNLQTAVWGWGTLLPALAIAALLAFCLGSRRVADELAERASDTTARRIGCLVAAAIVTAIFLMPALDTDATIGKANAAPLIPWGMDDPFAILNGRTPLVDFHAMYAQLTPYLEAGVMSVFGDTVGVYTALTTVMSAAALLAVYAILRRVVRSSLLALAVYVPFVAIGFLSVAGLPPGPRVNNVQIISMWPLRYGGAYLVAWLTARHLDGATPRRTWLLFFVAGLVACDNLEFGLAAFAAALVACAYGRRERSTRSLAVLAGTAAAGAVGAMLVVVLLTLARTGSLPKLSYLTEFPRLFGVTGLASLPMPAIGLHLALYVTFVAAIGTSTVRHVKREGDVLLTGMLAWSGVFGLLAASYYIGRSDALKLVSIFSAWGLAVALLLVVVARAMAKRTQRRPGIAELAVCLGAALAVCALVQVPRPWSELERLGDRTRVPRYEQAAAKRYIDDLTVPGEKVAILLPLGHRIAHDLDLTNVSSYAFIESIVTRGQFESVLHAMRAEGATKLFVSSYVLRNEHGMVLTGNGFARPTPRSEFSVWIDQLTPAMPAGAG